MKRAILVLVAVALLLGGVGPVKAALILNSGDLIAGDTSGHQLIEYTPGGTVVGALAFSGLPNTIVGVSVVGTDLYVADVSGNIGKVNPTTGAVSLFVSNSGDAEALGNSGTLLLLGDFVDKTVKEFKTDGSLVNTLPLPLPAGHMTGLDSNGTTLFVGSFDDGNIYKFDMAGNATGSISTGIGGSSISDTAFDPTTNTLWVSTGFNQRDIRHYDLSGNLLSSFTPSGVSINALDVVGADVTAAPEPASLTLLGIGAVCSLGYGWRRRKRAKA